MKVVDLFCGAGGFSEGFRQAGFDIVAAVDNNSQALTSHQINHPETNHYELDIATEDLSFLANYKPDVIIGSPPCTNFSRANNLNSDPSKGMELVDKFLDFVRLVKPKYWVSENVVQVRPHIRKHGFNGYKLNSVDFGVPQKRERYFFGEFIRPRATHQAIPMIAL